MWRIDFYADSNGNRPVAEWLDGLEKKDSAYIKDKIVRLQQNGPILLHTNMMKPLKGCGNDFFELIYSSFRIALFYDHNIDTYILLHGFKKERKRETREVETACSRLRAYKSRRW